MLVGAFALSTILSAEAGSSAPGSAEDPLVSESYVKSKVAALEARINELEAELAARENQTPGTATGENSASITPITPGTVAKVYIKQVQTPVNIRSNPSLQAPVLIKVAPGTALSWLKTSGEWYQVQLSSGQSGWVHNSVSELR